MHTADLKKIGNIEKLKRRRTDCNGIKDNYIDEYNLFAYFCCIISKLILLTEVLYNTQ